MSSLRLIFKRLSASVLLGSRKEKVSMRGGFSLCILAPFSSLRVCRSCTIIALRAMWRRFNALFIALLVPFRRASLLLVCMTVHSTPLHDFFDSFFLKQLIVRLICLRSCRTLTRNVHLAGLVTVRRRFGLPGCRLVLLLTGLVVAVFPTGCRRPIRCRPFVQMGSWA